MTRSAALIALAFRSACELDVIALKPGNVRDGAPFRDMHADDFRRSAAACAALLGATGRIGATIHAAIAATRRVVHCNTNLGIVLLAAPLCRAAVLDVDLRRGLRSALGSLDRDDAVEAYEIGRASCRERV